MKKIITENRNENTKDIDLISTLEIVKKINKEDEIVTKAIRKEAQHIADAVDIVAEAFLNEGKLLYFGAGTSGRLGVLDASECSPTFGVGSDIVQGVIAGGDTALRNAIEGAEDNYELGKNDALTLSNKDVCVLISASGNPKYLLGVGEVAKDIGCKVIAVTCNPEAKILEIADVKICVVVGAEVIAGSSRMKAGTAQKMILNILTTASMIKTGKTYENFMIDVQPTNEKLKKRAIQIVSDITGKSNDIAKEFLENCDWSVKTACFMLMKNVSKQEAIEKLKKHGNVLRKALKDE